MNDVSGYAAAVVNGAVAGAAVTAVVWAAMALAPRRVLNAATRYAVWWVVLAVVSAMPLWYWPARVGSGVRMAPAARAQVRAARTGATPEPRVEAGGALARRGWGFPLEIPPGPWLVWGLAAWAAASAVMLGRLVASLAMLRRLVGRAEARDGWLASDEVAAPVAVGPWRRAILIPAALVEELSKGELEQVRLHEAAHLARGDDYALVAQRVVEALMVGNPVVRWVARRIDLERESACDDVVVGATGDWRRYASCLTRVVELTGCVRVAAASSFSSHLTERVERLLDGARHAGTRVLRVRLAAVVAGLLVMAWMGARAPGVVAFAMAQGDRVIVPVVVHDGMQRYVTGLEREVFHIYQDDVEQEIAGFRAEERPITLGLVMDVREGGARLGELPVGPEDRFFVDVAKGMQAAALRSAAERLRGVRGAMVVVADGGSGVTAYRDAAVQAAIREAGVPVYVVGDPLTGGALFDLVRQTGGDVYDASDGAEMTAAVAKIAVGLRNLYVLEFVPREAKNDGSYHRLRVELTPPRGLPALTVRTRSGYYKAAP